MEFIGEKCLSTYSEYFDCEGKWISSVGNLTNKRKIWDCRQELPDCNYPKCPTNSEEILCLDWVRSNLSAEIYTANYFGQNVVGFVKPCPTGMICFHAGTEELYNCEGELLISRLLFVDAPFNAITNKQIIYLTGGNLPSCSKLPPWSITTTSQDHTIVLVKDLISEIDGQSLQAGDCVGFFYEHNGQEHCAGYGEWKANGEDILITLYGNDADASSKNGFDEGEAIKPKVWFADREEEKEVQAIYLGVGDLQGLIISKSNYEEDGFSGIKELRTELCLTLDISTKPTWLSSYVIPTNSSFESILDGQYHLVKEIKNSLKRKIFPSLDDFKDIPNWNPNETYSIRGINDFQLTICGNLLNPVEHPISIENGAQYIPYLKRGKTPIGPHFEEAIACITRIKDKATAKTYSPILTPPGDLTDLEPTKGYLLYGKCDATFSYDSFGSESPSISRNKNRNVFGLSHYFFDPTISENDATLIITKAQASTILDVGDELAVFNQNGLLVGANIYTGDNFYLTMLGDRKDTEAVEGLKEEEVYILKVWKTKTNQEFNLDLIYLKGKKYMKMMDFQLSLP